MAAKVDDARLIERIDTLSPHDRAASRSNPFAVVACSGELVTADEVQAASRAHFAGGFRCPKCEGEMRHYVSRCGTPYFAHAAARGNCPAGHETPAHLCIKSGLHSVGFKCEVRDETTGYRWDARHDELGVVAEVVCSGLDRYRPKILHTETSATPCWWILDSASPGLCSNWGSERICLATLNASGTVVVGNLFKPKVYDVFSRVSKGRLFAFYQGLMWEFIGYDRWRLLGESHALSQAAVAEDGIKHLMVKMHLRNSDVVTENKRKGVDRKTWFDSKFRFRGKFSMTWDGDREYVLEMVGDLIRDAEDAKSFIAKAKSRRFAGSPADPVHASAADILSRINQRHSVSVSEIAALQQIAEQSRVTRALTDGKPASIAAAPLVLDPKERRTVVMQQPVTSSRWGGDPSRGVVRSRTRILNAVNRKLLEIAAERGRGGMPSYYENNY